MHGNQLNYIDSFKEYEDVEGDEHNIRVVDWEDEVEVRSLLKGIMKNFRLVVLYCQENLSDDLIRHISGFIDFNRCY